jgi:predicted peroxiredoxin
MIEPIGKHPMNTQRLILVLWACGPDRPGGATLAAAPFVYALAARAMEIEVEMHFTSSAVRWLLDGVANDAYTDAARSKTVADFIAEVSAAGVQLVPCAMALAEHRRPGEALRAEVSGQGGAATVIGATFAPGTRTMVF